MNKRVFIERYLPDVKPSLEIIMHVGLNILPSSKYFGFFPWRHLTGIGKFIDFPMPIYPYFSKAKHAKDSSMNNVSIWINTKTSEFYRSTNIKKILLNGKPADYPLLVILPKHDTLLDPGRQEKVYKYISKKSKTTLLKCDGEHNIFLSNDTRRILDSVREYSEKII